MKPYIFKKKYIKEIYKFLYVLLYRGYCHRTIFYNGILHIVSQNGKRKIFYSKYKEKGEIGIYLGVPLYQDIEKIENKVLEIIIERNLEYYYEDRHTEFFDDTIEKFLVIDLKQNIGLAQELFESIIQEIFRLHNNYFDIYFLNVNDEPYKFIGFSEIPDFDKLGIDIAVPIMKGTMLIRKIKFFIAGFKMGITGKK